MADRKDIEFNFIGLDEGVRKAASIRDDLKEAAAYAKQIGGDGFDFGKYNTSIPGQGKTNGSGVGGDPVTNRDLELRYKRNSLKYYKNFGDYNKNFKSYAAEISMVTRGMFGIGANLVKLATGGALGGAAGFLGAVIPLAKSAVEDRKMALQLGGANIGKMKAAGNAFGNILNVPEAVGQIAKGQTDITDPAYKALKVMGFSNSDIQGSDPSDLLVRAMKIEQNRMKAYPNKQTGVTIEAARGATSIFEPNTLRALGALPAGEFETRKKQYEDTQKSLDLTQKEQQAVDRLTRSFDNARNEIETSFIREIALAAPALTAFSDAMGKATSDFIERKPYIDAKGKTHYSDKGSAAELWKELKDWLKSWFGDGKSNAPKSDAKPGDATNHFLDDITKTLRQEKDKFLGDPHDTWRPFFNDLEKDFKQFFDRMASSVDPLAAAAGINTGGIDYRSPGAPQSLARRGTHGGRWPDTGMTGVAASSADVQAAMDEAKKSGKFPDTSAGHSAFIKMMAPKYGIDPQFALDVANSEGLRSKRKSQGSNVDVDAQGNPYSFWDFQLNYRRGVGTFAAKEGINPDRPSDWMKADEFALRWMKEKGMKDWRTDAAFAKYHGQVKHVPVQDVKLPSPKSMNDMRTFQTSSKLAMTIHNAAGANVAVYGGMLGSGPGNYGSYT